VQSGAPPSPSILNRPSGADPCTLSRDEGRAPVRAPSGRRQEPGRHRDGFEDQAAIGVSRLRSSRHVPVDAAESRPSDRRRTGFRGFLAETDCVSNILARVQIGGVKTSNRPTAHACCWRETSGEVPLISLIPPRSSESRRLSVSRPPRPAPPRSWPRWAAVPARRCYRAANARRHGRSSTRLPPPRKCPQCQRWRGR
jgi:hypothetical protein